MPGLSRKHGPKVTFRDEKGIYPLAYDPDQMRTHRVGSWFARLIRSVRLAGAISRLTSSMCKDPANVVLLLPAKVSHSACSMTVVPNALPTHRPRSCLRRPATTVRLRQPSKDDVSGHDRMPQTSELASPYAGSL
jgi:hypothetical protein